MYSDQSSSLRLIVFKLVTGNKHLFWRIFTKIQIETTKLLPRNEVGFKSCLHTTCMLKQVCTEISYVGIELTPECSFLLTMVPLTVVHIQCILSRSEEIPWSAELTQDAGNSEDNLWAYRGKKQITVSWNCFGFTGFHEDILSQLFSQNDHILILLRQPELLVLW